MGRITHFLAIVMIAVTHAPFTSAQVTAPGATPTEVGNGYTFTEGPAADKDGNVYFTDVRQNKIHQWIAATPDRQPTLFIDNTGGTNGLYFDKHVNLIGCAGTDGRLISVSPDKTVTPIIETYKGKRFNRPNDLWIDPKGGIYFTDPAYGNVDVVQGGEHVYYLHPNRKTLTRVAEDFKRPNGLIGTPDGKTLYIADAGDGKIYRYTVHPDGELASKTLFVPDRGSDGMTIDHRGNVYLTSGSVWVYGPNGKLLQEIAVPKRPTNVTFGGTDFKTLFITARDSVYTLDVQTRGVRYP